MGNILSPQTINPALDYKQVSDQYVRKNFQRLSQYFAAQNQLLNFKFFEVVFTAANSSYSLSHGLGYVPQDIVLMNCVGSGVFTVNFGLATSTTINLSVTGAMRVRFFLGTYWNYQSTYNFGNTDCMQFTAVANSANSTQAISSKSSVTASASSSTSSSTSTSSTVPSGAVTAYAGITIPSGWLQCNGASVSQSTYPNLYLAIGNNYGTASAGLFLLPDYRGYFLRGVDGTAGRDPDKASRTAMASGGLTANNVGSVQTDQIKSHNHDVSMFDGGGGNLFGVDSGTSGTLGRSGSTAGGLNPQLTSSTGGNETRPKNAYVYWIIKT